MQTMGSHIGKGQVGKIQTVKRIHRADGQSAGRLSFVVSQAFGAGQTDKGRAANGKHRTDGQKAERQRTVEKGQVGGQTDI